MAGTHSSELASPASYGKKRMELTPHQWSNLFGDRMLSAAKV
jgi:hypothetical protein